MERTAACGPEVRRQECEQYARVFSGAQCARICPGWFIQATGPAPFLSSHRTASASLFHVKTSDCYVNTFVRARRPLL